MVEGHALGGEAARDQAALGVVADDVDQTRGEPQVVAAQRHPGARVADERLDGRHDVRVGERHRQRLDPHDGVDPGPADDEHVRAWL